MLSTVLGLCFTGGLALGASSSIGARDAALDSFVSTERAIALQGALNNIGPDGSEVPGATAGFVVASPSKVNPNCEYGAITKLA